jgi:hypothetical protein
MTFSTPVESDLKQKRMLDEINQRKKSSREYIDQLSNRLIAVTQDRDRKVRSKEDQLQQARANEAALANDDGALPDEVQGTEESLKQQLAEANAELAALQKSNSEDEAKQHRMMRKEEAVQFTHDRLDRED